MKTFLHVGPGGKSKHQTTNEFASDHWKEIRLDINPRVEADFHGSIKDMSDISSSSMDALYSSHNIEHIGYHEVPKALSEFFRVLNQKGFVVLTCPDLQSVSEEIAKGNLIGELYSSPAGPISALDVVYGHVASVRQGESYMAHRCGFTQKSLVKNFLEVGFKNTASMRRKKPYFDLWIVASKFNASQEELKALATKHFPQSS